MSSAEVRLELDNPTEAIRQEILGRDATREDVALTYALLMRDYRDQTDWSVVNAAIVERWSFSALEWIKRRAWQYVEGKRSWVNDWEKRVQNKAGMRARRER